MLFEVGRRYQRAHEIHGPYGGSRQSGISPSASHPLIFLFTGSSGAQYGYADDWTDDGVFLYTGEGQAGDMEFARGNRAIRDHVVDGKDLHLFEALGKGQPCRYRGQFVCVGWNEDEGPDRDGKNRKTIVFHLVPFENVGSFVPATAANEEDDHKRICLSMNSAAEHCRHQQGPHKKTPAKVSGICTNAARMFGYTC